MSAGLNMENVKRNNRAQILHLIHRQGPISRKDIADRLGLTPAAVTQICNDFIRVDLLVELGSEPGEQGKAGRKKILVELNPTYGCLCSINMDSVRTEISLCNLRGERIDHEQIPTETQNTLPKQQLERIGEYCRELLRRNRIPKKRLIGAGVGVPGPVDKKAGVSLHAYGIWEEEVPVVSILESCLERPVVLDNNVSAYACAELLFGEGGLSKSAMLVKWGPGVGASLLLGGKVYEPEGGVAELGHFIVKPDGEKCSCGRRGCLETIVSEKAMQHKSGEQRRQAIAHFAQALVNAGALVKPEKILLYGSMSRKDKEELVEICSSYDPYYGPERILISSLTEKEAFIGPAAIFVDREVLV